MKRILLLITILWFTFSNSIEGQTWHQQSDNDFIGYLDELPVFFEGKSSRIFIKTNDEKKYKKFVQPTFSPQLILDSLEILYNFNYNVYIVIIGKDTFEIKNEYKSIAVDPLEKKIYVTQPEYDPNHPLGIIMINLKTNEKKYTGYNGYIDRVVGDNLFFYIESNPTNIDSPYNMFQANKNGGYKELIFERLVLTREFQISHDGKYFYGYGFNNCVIINLITKEKQNISLPLINPSGLPPFFSFDNEYLIFYNSETFEIVKVKVEI